MADLLNVGKLSVNGLTSLSGGLIVNQQAAFIGPVTMQGGLNLVGPHNIPHNDTWVNTENVDPTHPARLNYVIPLNALKVVEARLSFRLLTYRTYSNFTVSATGGTSNNHSHDMGSHSHKMWTAFGGSPGSVGESFTAASGSTYGVTAAGTFAVVENTFPTSPGGTAGQSADHTHTISGSSFLGVAEGTAATGVTIQFDTVDQTTALNGPWATDQVEIDVLRFLPQLKGIWHTINLTSTQLGQIQSHLRISLVAQQV